jgi:hypothetical protein
MLIDRLMHCGGVFSFGGMDGALGGSIDHMVSFMIPLEIMGMILLFQA